jgi:uncharacterized membrane protein
MRNYLMSERSKTMFCLSLWLCFLGFVLGLMVGRATIEDKPNIYIQAHEATTHHL